MTRLQTIPTILNQDGDSSEGDGIGRVFRTWGLLSLLERSVKIGRWGEGEGGMTHRKRCGFDPKTGLGSEDSRLQWHCFISLTVSLKTEQPNNTSYYVVTKQDIKSNSWDTKTRAGAQNSHEVTVYTNTQETQKPAGWMRLGNLLLRWRLAFCSLATPACWSFLWLQDTEPQSECLCEWDML